MNKTNGTVIRVLAAGILLAALPLLFFSACPQAAAPENSRKRETVTIVLDANGGVFGDGSSTQRIIKTIGTGMTLSELPEAQRERFIFAGWYTGQTGDNKYDFSKVAGADLTLYARWTWSFTVTFDANGGTIGGGSASTTPRTVASPATTVTRLPEAVNGNNAFLGWFIDKDTWETPFTVDTEVTGDIRVYARWNSGPIYLTVTFNANGGQFGGTTTEKFAQVTIPGDGKVPAGQWPADPVLAGKEFDGWYTLAEGGTLVTAAAVITESQTLYAHWADYVPPFSLTLNANGGKWPSGDTEGDTEKTISGKVNQPAGDKMPANPARGGYLFQGWNTQADGAGTEFTASTVIVDETMTVYAKWTMNTAITSISYAVEGAEFVGTLSNGEKIGSAFNDGTTVQTVNGLAVLNFRDGATNAGAENGGYSEVALDPIAGAFIYEKNWTIEMYFKMDRLSVKLDPLQIYATTINAGSGGTLRIEHNTGGETNWYIQTYSPGRQQFDIGQRPVQNQWFHLAIVREGSTVKSYFNGELKTTQAAYGDYYDHASFKNINNVHAGRAQNAGLYQYIFTKTSKTAEDFAGVMTTVNTLNGTGTP